MEPLKKAVRYKVIIAKCQVTKIQDGEMGTKFWFALPQGITVEADLSFRPDVRVGDILTIYTEVLAHAQPSTTSIQ